jgi:hypothetical protein
MYFIRDSETFDKSPGMLARVNFQRAMRLALAITQRKVSALAQLAVEYSLNRKKSVRRVATKKRAQNGNRRAPKSGSPVDRL